jgi:predicted DNA-binding ribbon-helix-helix protein
MSSPIKKRSISIHGRKTSISLEDEFFAAAVDVARARGMPLSHFVETLRPAANLSSAIRIAVLKHYQGLATPSTG